MNETDTKALPQSERDKLGFVTDDNTGGYYVAECEQCGKVFPSQTCEGGGQIADTGDYDDCYCPHCGFIDPLECDNANLVWNVQQLKIINLTNQLEAERQRADELESSNDRIRQRWVDEVSNNCDAGKRVNELEAELSALRGAQEPVGFTAECEVSNMRATGLYLRAWPDDSREDYNIPLFTRQPKPVVDLTNVLKVPYRISGQSFAAYDSDDLHAALEADGIVVNDGELATITCWSCRKSMNLAQHSSNDGLCPHCNVEIDLEE